MTSPYVVNQFVIITCTCSAIHRSPHGLDVPLRYGQHWSTHSARSSHKPFHHLTVRRTKGPVTGNDYIRKSDEVVSDAEARADA